MAPFEALYGRRCRTLLLWEEVGDRQLFGPDLIKESKEKVKLIRDCYLLSTALVFLEKERVMQQSSVNISLSF